METIITSNQVAAALEAFNAFPCPSNGSIARSFNEKQMESAIRAALAASQPAPVDASTKGLSLHMANCQLVGGNLNGNLPILFGPDGVTSIYLDGWIMVGPTSPIAPQVQAMAATVAADGMPEDIEDPVIVPRGLLGAACSAIDKKRDAAGEARNLSLQQVADRIDGRGVMSPTEFRRFLNGDGVEMYPHQIAELVNLFIQDSERDAARDDDAKYDADRLLFAIGDIDGFVGVEWDKYDYAMHFARENGHDEPTKEDELIGLRALIDAAMAANKG